MAEKIRISASRLKALSECSWAFYCKEILMMPEVTHPKTHVGSVCHSIFEFLSKPRHKKHYDSIIKSGAVSSSAAISRYIKMARFHYKLDDALFADMDSMIMVGLNHDFFGKQAVKVLPPEYEFKIDLKSGFVLKGYIDRALLYDKEATVRDYKSQGQKFPKASLSDNFQAATYQLAIKRQFNLPAKVEFLLLRHAPTKKTPDKYLQVVEPLSDAELNGFENYLNEIASKINSFSEKNACENFRASQDSGFCERVCQFKDPKQYYVLMDGNGKIIKTSPENDLIPLENQKVKVMRYNGCKYFYKGRYSP